MTISRIGIIGVGVMGEALIAALLRSGTSPSSIVIREKRADRSAEMVEKYSVATGSISGCDAVFLLVKPQDLVATLQELRSEISSDALVVSFIAGKSTATIESLLQPSQRVIRVMPNTPMTLGKGFAAMSKGAHATSDDLFWLEQALSSSSAVITIPESDQDAITALSGSGPAYFFLMVEAMAEAGKNLGLNQDDALKAAKEVLIGAAALVEKSGKDPKTLRENVTSPNGTTHAALTTFSNEGFREIVYRAMKAAQERSIELSQ